MLSLGFLGFAQPWLLGALLALPALWLLLRVTPPSPRRIAFPPIDLLRRLFVKEETPARTPWWLLALRMAIIGLLILAFARPIVDPAPALEGSGPAVIVLDDGWAAAAHWSERLEALQRILEQADRELRPVFLIRTAHVDATTAVSQSSAREMLASIESIVPSPWPVDRAAMFERVTELSQQLQGTTPAVFWLSDGIALNERDRAVAADLALALRQLGSLQIQSPDPASMPLLLDQPTQTPEGLTLRGSRAIGGGPLTLFVSALNENDEVLARVSMDFEAQARDASARFDLPLDLRNRIAKVEIEPAFNLPSTIGGTVLFDERWRRHSVGLIGDENEVRAQPLLAELYFIERALAPFAEIRTGTLNQLLDTPLSMIVMPDSGTLDTADRARLRDWIAEGGVVLRFAGPKLAASSSEFVPVPLRSGDRRLGGALSWSEPLALAAFPENGPFAELTPTEDILVYRQVLAQPGP
ncbi:MAG: BatA domain-containing protein, partial [Pseudomonadota bacterium]